MLISVESNHLTHLFDSVSFSFFHHETNFAAFMFFNHKYFLNTDAANFQLSLFLIGCWQALDYSFPLPLRMFFFKLRQKEKFFFKKGKKRENKKIFVIEKNNSIIIYCVCRCSTASCMYTKYKVS